MSTLIALYVANMREFLRNRMTIFWNLAFPILFILLFGFIFSGNGGASYTAGVVDHDNSAASQQLIGILDKNFTVKTGAFSTEQAALKKGDVDMVIVIPNGLNQSVKSKQAANIQMLYDPSRNTTSANIELYTMQGILTGFNEALANTPTLVQLQPSTINTTPLRTIDFLVPGILAMALMQLGLFGTAMPIVQLRQQQVLRRLGATPLPRWQVMLAQVLMRVTLALIQTAVIVGLGALVFHVTVINPVGLLGVVLLGAAAFIGIGYLIASVSSTADAATGITQALNFPMMFLSGIFFPLALLPTFLKPIIYALPVTYLADVIRQVMVGSTPEFPMITDILVLAAWFVGTALIATRLFKWE